MATKIDRTYEVTVKTLGGNSFEAKDTETSAAGKKAKDTFFGKDIVVIERADDTVYVPYHAVDHVIIKETAKDTEYTDDNCVVEESDDNSEENGEG